MKSFFERLGGTYYNEGDYLILDIVAPEAPHVGAWGRKRKRFLQQYHDSIYTAMLLAGKLNAHLEEIDRSANEMFELLMNQYAKQERVTEQLKAEDQMEWVRRMNNIRECVEESQSCLYVIHRAAGRNPRPLYYLRSIGNRTISVEGIASKKIGISSLKHSTYSFRLMLSELSTRTTAPAKEK